MAAATIETNTDRHNADIMPGDQALAIFNQYRSLAGEHLYVRRLSSEFPSLRRSLGVRGCLLAGADTSLAGAFKVRGNIVAMHAYSQAEAGFIVPSAGNAARGAAVAANLLQVPLTAVVPVTAPPEKSEGIKTLYPSKKLNVITHGNSFDEASLYATNLSYANNQQLLSPFDDPNVIAGQGTMVDDILAVAPDITNIVVPVGGGGLAAGIQKRLSEIDRYDIRLHLAEATGSDSLSLSLAAGVITEASRPNQLFSGSAVRRVGGHCLKILQSSGVTAENVTQVTDAEVKAVAEDYLSDRHETMITTAAYEPTSLLAFAALKKCVDQGEITDADRPIVIATGHNAPLAEMFSLSNAHRSHIARGLVVR